MLKRCCSYPWHSGRHAAPRSLERCSANSTLASSYLPPSSASWGGETLPPPRGGRLVTRRALRGLRQKRTRLCSFQPRARALRRRRARRRSRGGTTSRLRIHRTKSTRCERRRVWVLWRMRTGLRLPLTATAAHGERRRNPAAQWIKGERARRLRGAHRDKAVRRRRPGTPCRRIWGRRTSSDCGTARDAKAVEDDIVDIAGLRVNHGVVRQCVARQRWARMRVETEVSSAQSPRRDAQRDAERDAGRRM